MTAATFDLTGSIIAHEQGDLDHEGTLALFSYLVKTGIAWQLQGSYGRAAHALIRDGWIEAETGEVLK